VLGRHHGDRIAQPEGGQRLQGVLAEWRTNHIAARQEHPVEYSRKPGVSFKQKHSKRVFVNFLSFRNRPLDSSWTLTKVITEKAHHNPYDEIFESYFKKLSGVIPAHLCETNAKSSLQFVYSAMHGVGYPFVEHGFKTAGLQPLLAVEEQRDANPDFPTVKFPNPEEGKSSLELSIRLAKAKGVSVILANDPDADRLAAAESDE
jgi:phosphomannomutase